MTIWELSKGQKNAVRELTNEQKEMLWLQLENEALKNEIKALKSEVNTLKPKPREHKDSYTCVCGRVDYTPQAFAGHTRSCAAYQARKETTT